MWTNRNFPQNQDQTEVRSLDRESVGTGKGKSYPSPAAQSPKSCPCPSIPIAVTLPMHDLRSVSWLESCSFLKNQFFQLFLRQVIQLHIKLEGCFSYRLNNTKKKKKKIALMSLCCWISCSPFMDGEKIWKCPSQKYLVLSSLQGRTPLLVLYVLYILIYQILHQPQ